MCFFYGPLVSKEKKQNLLLRLDGLTLEMKLAHYLFFKRLIHDS